MATIHATRALALVGTPFRPQGRDAAHGLDCVGLCLAAYDLPRLGRDDYRLRGDHYEEFEAAVGTWFRKVDAERARQGDMLLLRPAADQLHLAIVTAHGFVHADALLRRIVEAPGKPVWPVAATFRLRARSDR